MKAIYLEGSVGMSFWDEPAFTAADLRAQIGDETGDLTVFINSGGGIADEGVAIYNALVAHPGQIHVVITGIAASAASLIAMAGDTITMNAGAEIMIHDPANDYSGGRGTADDHKRKADELETKSQLWASIYAARTGLPVAEVREMMRAETFLQPDDALAKGFATHVDAAKAVARAAWNYAIYRNAPAHMPRCAGANGPDKVAALAMICGLSDAPTPKESAMSDQIEDDLMTEEDQETTAEDIEETEAETEETKAEDAPEDEDGDDDTAAILDLVALMGDGADVAAGFIRARKTLAQVTAHYRKKGSAVAQIQQTTAHTRITRDETETRRQGMTTALVAQMSRQRDVSGPARDFMQYGLLDMAAACVGHRGPIRNGSGAHHLLQRALASNATGDFPGIFSDALNKRLLQTYQAASPTYRQIGARMDFTDFRPHPITGVGDFPTLLPVGEGGEIKMGTTADKSETVALGAYGRQFRITRQMLVNDDLGAIDRILQSRGIAVAAFEDAVFYAMLLGGANGDGPTLSETGRQMFNTTDLTKSGAAAAITIASVSAGRSAMMKKKSLGKKEEDQIGLEIAPSILLVGPDKLTEAEQLVTAITPDQAGNVNPFSGRLTVVASNKITGNAWYLFADPAIAPVAMYGYLAGEEGPRMRMDEPFGQQGVAYSVELDFGTGGVGFLGGYKNAGA